MLKSPLSVPDKDQVTVSLALYVDTAVWFSCIVKEALPVITGGVVSVLLASLTKRTEKPCFFEERETLELDEL